MVLKITHHFRLSTQISVFLTEKRQVAKGLDEGHFQVRLGLFHLIKDGANVMLRQRLNLFACQQLLVQITSLVILACLALLLPSALPDWHLGVK